MCFHVDRENPREMIADRDIPCFKVLKGSTGSLYAPIYSDFIYFRAMSLRRKREVRSELDTLGAETYGVIEKGLHSYSTPRASLKTYSDSVHKAYIPKGARYWYNSKSKEYVSDRLVVFRKKIRCKPENKVRKVLEYK